MVAVRVECALNLTRWHTTTSFIIITTTTLVLKIHFPIMHANGSSFVRIWHHKRHGNHDCYNHRNKCCHLLVLFFFIFWNNINKTNITRFNPATFLCLSQAMIYISSVIYRCPFFLFSELRWEAIIRFGDICGILDHHVLTFRLTISGEEHNPKLCSFYARF